jgi:hypothetical protein
MLMMLMILVAEPSWNHKLREPGGWPTLCSQLATCDHRENHSRQGRTKSWSRSQPRQFHGLQVHFITYTPDSGGVASSSVALA